MNHTQNPDKSKVLFTLDSPYPKSKWPVIPADAQSTILDLLLNFLRPIGDHRWQRFNISTEKRRKRGSKRKRSVDETASENYTKIPYPEVLDFVTIGHNMTTRHLEALAQKSEQTLIHSQTTPDSGSGIASFGPDLRKPLVAVFVSCAEQPPIMHSHLPYLVKAASLSSPSLPSICLITLPSGAETQLSRALRIRRVDLVGLLYDSPTASDLIDFLRAQAPAVEIPWLQDSITGVYFPTTIKPVHTTSLLEWKTKSGGEKIKGPRKTQSQSSNTRVSASSKNNARPVA
ncbi:hypothetical protein MMC31_000270 [Peltigera leucophlebia]|nr:hypothetical protein [Peltigera leucophlebia]